MVVQNGKEWKLAQTSISDLSCFISQDDAVSMLSEPDWKYWRVHVVHISAEGERKEMLTRYSKEEVRSSDLLNLLTIQDKAGKTCAHHLVMNGSVGAIKCVVDALTPADLNKLWNVQDGSNFTILHYAALQNQSEMVKCLFSSVSSEDLVKLLLVQSCNDDTALHCAAYQGHTNFMEYLADVLDYESMYQLFLVQNGERCTVMHYAVAEDYNTIAVEFISQFLSNKDLFQLLRKPNFSGNTALHDAMKKHNLGIIKHFSENISANNLFNLLAVQNNEGLTPLHYAASTGHTGIMKLLVRTLSTNDFYTLVVMQDKLEETVLHKAVYSEETDMLKCVLDKLTLIQLFNSLRIPNIDSLTPQDVAEKMIAAWLWKYQEEKELHTTREETAAVDDLDVGYAVAVWGDTDIDYLRNQEKILIADKEEIIARLYEVNRQLQDTRQQLQEAAIMLFTDQLSDVDGEKPDELAKSDVTTSLMLTDNVKSADNDDRHIQSLNTSEDSDDRDSVLDFLESCVVADDFKPMPQSLVELINQRCKEHKLRHAVISQSAKDWTKILVLLVNPENFDLHLTDIPTDHPEFHGFELIVENQEDPIQNDSDCWEGQLIVRKNVKHRGEVEWTSVDRFVRCEFIVKAEPVNTVDARRVEVFYAVVPAHLILNKEQRRKVEKPCAELKNIRREMEQLFQVVQNPRVGRTESRSQQVDILDEHVDVNMERTAIAKMRLEVEKLTSRHMYAIHIKGKTNPSVDLKLPPLFCYRECFYKQTEHSIHTGHQEPENRERCPAGRCNFTYGKKACHHEFINDIALLPLESNYAKELQGLLETTDQPPLSQKVIAISLTTHLKFLQNKRCNIRVKNCPGTLCTPVHTFEAEEDQGLTNQIQRGAYITFILNNPHDVLEKGDSGAIVYLVPRTGAVQPLGMYIGKSKLNSQQSSDPLKYKAIALFPAFRDLEEDYPHHVKNISQFRLT